jgi:hypothetical protein
MLVPYRRERLTSKQRGVRISPSAPLISLESRTCSHFLNGLKFDFRSIRSNNAVFGRKFKVQTDFLCNCLPEFHVLFQL